MIKIGPIQNQRPIAQKHTLCSFSLKNSLVFIDDFRPLYIRKRSYAVIQGTLKKITHENT